MPLSVPVPSRRGVTKVTLDQCISAFVKEEILEKDDAWSAYFTRNDRSEY